MYPALTAPNRTPTLISVRGAARSHWAQIQGGWGPGEGESVPVAVVVGRTARGAVSEGRRRADKVARPSRLRLYAALVGGSVVAGAAWWFLVGAAIDFGRVARGGEGGAWVFTVLATLGATVCLLLVLLLLARLLVSVGLISDYTPRRSAGRRTAR